MYVKSPEEMAAAVRNNHVNAFLQSQQITPACFLCSRVLVHMRIAVESRQWKKKNLRKCGNHTPWGIKSSDRLEDERCLSWM